MAGLAQSIVRSTIGARVAAVLLVPLAGLLFFGALAAVEEQASAADAREVRREAELVELLSTAAIRLEMEFDSLAGLHEAAALGVDVSGLPMLGDRGALDELGRSQAMVDDLLDEVEQQDTARWADPVSVEQLIEARPLLTEARRQESDRAGLRSISIQLGGSVGSALDAQTDQLHRRLAAVELDPELASVVRAVDRSRQLMSAAQADRRALSELLLPLTDEPVETRYRRLVAASAQMDLVLADLRGRLGSPYAEQLDSIQAAPQWISYTKLKDQALAEEITPPEAVAQPLTMLPYALTSYVQGFERIRDLLELDRQLSADLTAGALDLEAEAVGRLVRAGLVGLVLGFGTVSASFVTISSITKPLGELQGRAERISDGDLDTAGPRRGPRDIALVHTTLDAMSTNLRTLSAQTEALSDGRLDDEVLGRTVAGPLGASVHGSVVRLRSVTAKLEYEATHDTLTGLPNRAALISLLERCLTGRVAQRRALAAIMLDLDGFKQTNDDMGHAIGDEVLVHVARRLRKSAGGGFVARLGGDEFMIVITGEGGSARAAEVAATAIEAICCPFAVSSGTLTLSASAGIVATASPEWLSPTELLRRVDLAMYEAKLDGPGEVVRFDQRLHDSLLETTMLQGELRQALDHEEFELHLQPIVATGNREAVGYEALIRWSSPTRGQVSPGLFIPVAEQSELIVQIDRWVIDKAVEMLAALQREDPDTGVTMSINVSARHLSNASLVSTVRSAIERHRARAEGVVIEITESQLIPNLARAESSLRGLKALGVKLAIDDFGTGYASVAHLRRVEFDRLKIDQSFLAHLDDETDRSLAGLLVSLGRDLDLEVVAEGIETEAQFRWASEAGCTHAQGYLLGRPSPAVDTLGERMPAPPDRFDASDAVVVRRRSSGR